MGGIFQVLITKGLEITGAVGTRDAKAEAL